MDIDRFPDLGRRVRISSFEDALRLVREVHPGASQHGSTGVERTWTVGDPPWRRIVAHHWSPSSGAAGKPWWLRISPVAEDGPWFDHS
jgi:hypothetical protein